MKRQLIILLLLCLGASSLRAQDTAAVRGVVPLRSDTIPSCRRRPVNDYPGLNSLMRRLANPGWNGLMKDIHTGLKLEGGRIRPLGGSLTEADAGISPVTSSGSYAGENAEAAGAPVTSSGSLGKCRLGHTSSSSSALQTATLRILRRCSISKRRRNSPSWRTCLCGSPERRTRLRALRRRTRSWPSPGQNTWRS